MTGLKSNYSENLKQHRHDAICKYGDRKKPPSVGIFWYHNNKVLGDFFELTDADLYETFLGPHSCHYGYWKNIQKQNPQKETI